MIERPKYLNQLVKYKDKDIIKVITGVRRCGKSVLLFDIFAAYLLENGVEKSNIIKVNLENPENIRLRESFESTFFRGMLIMQERLGVPARHGQARSAFPPAMPAIRRRLYFVNSLWDNSALTGGALW